MKRTTYIIFGMLLTGLVVVCAGIFYASMQVTGWDNIFLDIKGEKKAVQLPECKVIQMVAVRNIITTGEGEEKGIRMPAFGELPLKITPAEAGQGTFTYASGMDEFMTMNSVGDTLRIVFDFPNDKLEKKYQDLYWLNLRSEEMTIALPNHVQFLQTSLEAQKMTVEGLTHDSLSLMVQDYATINDCNFRALTVQNGAWLFNTGKADNLYLHLNGIRSWNVNASSFHVDTEYLYAHGNQKCTLEKGECRQVVWMPQSEGASLNIKLKEAATVVVN